MWEILSRTYHESCGAHARQPAYRSGIMNSMAFVPAAPSLPGRPPRAALPLLLRLLLRNIHSFIFWIRVWAGVLRSSQDKRLLRGVESPSLIVTAHHVCLSLDIFANDTELVIAIDASHGGRLLLPATVLPLWRSMEEVESTTVAPSGMFRADVRGCASFVLSRAGAPAQYPPKLPRH